MAVHPALPEPLAIPRQPLLPQPCWNQDVGVTRRRKTAYNNTRSFTIRMIDTEDIPPPLFTQIFPDNRRASLGTSRRREPAHVTLADERQNVVSRNASLASSNGSEKENALRLNGKTSQPFLAQHEERSASLTSGLKSGVRERHNLSSHTRCVSALPTLDIRPRGRDASQKLTPDHSRAVSASSPARKSPVSRPKSYVDLLNVPYPQPAPAPLKFDNGELKSSVGRNAALLSRQQTLEMYRANVKKTTDVEVQYSFALLLIETAQEMAKNKENSIEGSTSSPAELLLEARTILQRLADKSYPFAQYYLADGYASGFFNSKGRPDDEKAFPLFISASKHGHAEASYRSGLSYEYGWGTRRDPAKAIQFYRQSASKNHPGSMTRLSRACLTGDLGGGVQYREGIKWLKRASESADKQYNSAPYDLGCLHETGYGADVFKDEHYAAQLFTQAADLNHADAAFKLGQAYEFGKLSCPKDPSLSVHFYAIAATQGHAQAMFALCAWYMVGAEPVLAKDEAEAYEWASKAAQLGLAKAQYALAYFSEAGIGGRRDPLQANTWYVRAAEQGDEKAIKRIRAIKNAASSSKSMPLTSKSDDGSGKKWKLFS